MIPNDEALTSQQLIDIATHFESSSLHQWMMSHIYYCAAALKKMHEEGLLKFLVSQSSSFSVFPSF